MKNQKKVYKQWWFYLLIILAVALVTFIIVMIATNAQNTNKNVKPTAATQITETATVDDGKELKGETETETKKETEKPTLPPTEKPTTAPQSKTLDMLLGNWSFDLDEYNRINPDDPLTDKQLKECENWFLNFSADGLVNRNIYGQEEAAHYELAKDNKLTISSEIKATEENVWSKEKALDGIYLTWYTDGDRLYLNHFCYKR